MSADALLVACVVVAVLSLIGFVYLLTASIDDAVTLPARGRHRSRERQSRRRGRQLREESLC